MSAEHKLSKMPITERAAKEYNIGDTALLWILENAAAGISDGDVANFIYQISRTGLDPLARQIYLVGRPNKGKTVGTVQTGIDGYRLIASRTGQYSGSLEPMFDGDQTLYANITALKERGIQYPTTATVTVCRAVGGVVGHFVAPAAWDQYYPGDGQGYMWRKMPHVMLSKVAEALALRKAFPAELSGIYTTEEMDQADRDLSESQSTVSKLQAQSRTPGEKSVPAATKLSNSEIIRTLIEKVEALGVNPTDSAIAEYLGQPLPEIVEVNDENKDKLRILWSVADQSAKSGMNFHTELKNKIGN